MKSLFAFFSNLLIATSLMAQEVPPDALIKSVTNEVLDIVRKDKEIQSGNTKKAIELVEAKVLPHFNFTRMTQLALARDWRQANAAQQKTLTDEFRHLLVRTYSKALTEYKSASRRRFSTSRWFLVDSMSMKSITIRPPRSRRRS